MEKEVVFFAVLVLFSISFTQGQNYLSPDAEGEVFVAVDSSYPVVKIYSPTNTTYNNLTAILVNFTVQDITHDSTWYSLNNQNNISVSGPFYLELAEGGYSLRIYANDSRSRENYSEVFFSVDNSFVFCGNNYCDAGEGCNSCPGDCGSCPPPEGNGGGGNGGGGNNGGGTPITPKTIRDFQVDKEQISISLEQGENTITELIIKNNGTEKLDFEIENDLSELMKIIEKTFTLAKGESKKIHINIFTKETTKTDLYLGKIIIKADGLEKTIPISIEIVSKGSLFDISIELEKEYYLPGEEMRVNVSLTRLFGTGGDNVTLNYFIKSQNDNSIFYETESQKIQRTLELTKNIKIPEDASFGKHILYVQLDYQNKIASASKWFNIDYEPGEKKIKKYFWRIIIIILSLLIILFILYYYLKKKNKPRKYQFEGE